MARPWVAVAGAVVLASGPDLGIAVGASSSTGDTSAGRKPMEPTPRLRSPASVRSRRPRRPGRGREHHHTRTRMLARSCGADGGGHRRVRRAAVRVAGHVLRHHHPGDRPRRLPRNRPSSCSTAAVDAARRRRPVLGLSASPPHRSTVRSSSTCRVGGDRHGQHRADRRRRSRPRRLRSAWSSCHSGVAGRLGLVARTGGAIGRRARRSSPVVALQQHRPAQLRALAGVVR